MAGEIIARVISELGPWLWIAASLILMAAEMFSGRGIALSAALGAFVAGTIAVMGVSGVWPAISSLIQALIFLASAITIFLAIKSRTKNS